MKATVAFSREENLREAQGLPTCSSRSIESPKPVIARVHGAARAGDGARRRLRHPVAALGTQFGFTEVRLGIIPAVISRTW